MSNVGLSLCENFTSGEAIFSYRSVSGLFLLSDPAY